MNCREIINQVLKSMDVDFTNVQEFIKADEESVVKLAALSDECSGELVSTSRELLHTSNEKEGKEYELQLLIRSVARRGQPETFELISEALLHVDSEDKETYVKYLIDLGDLRAVDTLTKFVTSYDVTDDDSESALVLAIDFLRQHKAVQATEGILPKLEFDSPEVRRSAIEFLISLDSFDYEKVFLQRLEKEDDPELIKLMRDALNERKKGE